MKRYFIEGLFVKKDNLKRSSRGRKGPQADVEPYAKTIWAASPAEALEIATQELEGGQWVGEPKVSQTSEEQRMRRMGAPELPGFTSPGKSSKTPPKKSARRNDR